MVVEEKTKEGDLKIYTALPILLNILLLGSLASPQQGHTTEAPGKLEIAKHPLILEPPIRAETPNLDPVKLRAEADELAKLAQSVPADVDQVTQGMLNRAIAEKLKRIEKISKH